MPKLREGVYTPKSLADVMEAATLLDGTVATPSIREATQLVMALSEAAPPCWTEGIQNLRKLLEVQVLLGSQHTHI